MYFHWSLQTSPGSEGKHASLEKSAVLNMNGTGPNLLFIFVVQLTQTGPAWQARVEWWDTRKKYKTQKHTYEMCNKGLGRETSLCDTPVFPGQAHDCKASPGVSTSSLEVNTSRKQWQQTNYNWNSLLGEGSTSNLLEHKTHLIEILCLPSRH